jgi:2-methylcitrate dehydratase PrpD
MALLDELAKFISRVTFEGVPSETVRQTKLHIFDSLGAVLAGARTEEGKANADLIQELFSVREEPGVLRPSSIVHRPSLDLPVPGFSFSAPLPFALLLSCVAARLTETDDIDIASCTTVGSVVVPASLLLSFKRGSTGKELVEGVIIGYEVITRLGAAVNGAGIIYRGIWPTYLCAAIGVAAVGSKILGLTPEQIRNALAIALAMSPGIAARIKGGLTSRWLSLGCAAQNGLIACLAAARGFAGDQRVLEGSLSSFYGLDLKPQILLEGLGQQFQIGKVNFKPYCSARQAIAPIEAFQRLLNTYRIAPETIEEVEVIVPRQYSQMIDRPGFPEDRLASITGIRYQLALAAFYEDDLFDVERKVLRDEKKVHTFMRKIQVSPSDSMSANYPEKWPGKILLRADGKRYDLEVLTPRGDSDHPMTWEDVEEKTKRITRRFVDPANITKLGASVKGLDLMERVDTLLHLLSSHENR